MEHPQYEVTAPIPVRFRDLDALGHVNNSVFATYLEMARVEYYRQLDNITDPREYQVVIAHVSIDYLHPILLSDSVVCHIRVSQLGNTSFTFEYLLRNPEDGTEFARARSVQVGYDFENGAKMPVNRWKEKVPDLKARKGVVVNSVDVDR